MSTHDDSVARFVVPMLAYGDWANDLILGAAQGLDDEKLDRGLEIGPGPGTLRRILAHTWAGEWMWTQRWKNNLEARWPAEQERWPVAEIRGKFAALRPERDEFVRGLAARPGALGAEQVYRDSRGGMYRATLADMIAQAVTHSTHHRAQAVNALRRLGGPVLEVDYMMRVRRGAE